MRRLLIITSLVVGIAQAQSVSVRTLHCVATSSPVIDGKLEAEWSRAPAGTDFTQLNPNEGKPATQRTEVRVMHSSSALYVAFRCYDTNPSKIFSPLTKHDRVNDCDQVTFYLDPYHDHRTGYFFTTTPGGVEQEGVFYNDNYMDLSWDGYWEVATARDDSGWTAEMKIPFSTLRFHNQSGEQTWGMNAQRYVWRDKESSYWQPFTRDKGRRVSGFGHLEGLSSLKPGSGLELRPYAVANFEENGPQRLHGKNDWNNFGLDVKYRLAPNLTADATLNPDFAQIEADDQVINLSDYPVFLTEKRPFFLEGASIFDTPAQLFYSRRITDPDAGAKISGKVGSIRMMALAARNRNAERQIEDFGVLRLKRDIFKKSELGVLFTNKQGPNQDYARVWDADVILRPTDLWTITGMSSQSFKPGHGDHNRMNYLEADFLKDKYSGEVSWSAMMRDFNVNDAGYTKYSDYQRFYTWLQYAPRPEKWGIRRFSNNVNLTFESFYDFSHQGNSSNYNGQLETMNYMYLGWGIEYDDYVHRQYVDAGEPYFNYDNYGNYNPVRYRGWSEWLWYQSDFSKPLALSLNYSLGDFRDGYERDASASVQVRPQANLQLSLTGSYTHLSGVQEINNGQGTNYFVGSFKTEWTLTTRLFTRLNLQYIHGNEIYLTNALFGYNFAPQSWFYLAYDDQKGDLLGWQTIQKRIIKMKVSYFVKV